MWKTSQNLSAHSWHRARAYQVLLNVSASARASPRPLKSEPLGHCIFLKLPPSGVNTLLWQWKFSGYSYSSMCIFIQKNELFCSCPRLMWVNTCWGFAAGPAHCACPHQGWLWSPSTPSSPLGKTFSNNLPQTALSARRSEVPHEMFWWLHLCQCKASRVQRGKKKAEGNEMSRTQLLGGIAFLRSAAKTMRHSLLAAFYKWDPNKTRWNKKVLSRIFIASVHGNDFTKYVHFLHSEYEMSV